MPASLGAPLPPFAVTKKVRGAVRSLAALPVDDGLALICSALRGSATARDRAALLTAGRLLIWDAYQAERRAA